MTLGVGFGYCDTDGGHFVAAFLGEPGRTCFDLLWGSAYLRARYYSPGMGRFLNALVYVRYFLLIVLLLISPVYDIFRVREIGGSPKW